MAVSNRRKAAFALQRWLLTKDHLSELLPDGPDRAFVQDVLYTTVRRLSTLRKALGMLIERWPKGELEALLYIGAAQILFMRDVPDFAAVNETVAAAEGSNNPNVKRVVNGVLRNLIRRREEIERAIAADSLEIRESFPRALIRRWLARFGTEKTERLCQYHNQPAETYLAGRDGSFKLLARGHSVASEAGYEAGDFIVQDPATALAISLLAPRSGERILDACAAPGGKTVQIAWRGAEVTACEVNPKRRQRLMETLARTKVAAEVIEALPSIDSGTIFDKVLVDAPCSNTGVLRRRPDARWNWSEAKLASLVQLQARLLDTCAPLVAPGGKLVYSTCSNENEENLAQAEAFVARHPEFKLERAEESLPFESGYDGAFAAVFARKK